MKRTICSMLALMMALSMAACGANPAASSSQEPSSEAVSSAVSPEASSSEAAPAEQVELMVSAAASLTDCLNEIKGLYEKENGGITITYNFAASGALQQQIEQGAPADVFFSAGKKQMQALSDAGLMDDSTVKDIVENKVVLITPKGGTKLASFEELANVKQIGVGEPETVPVGQYTAEVFENLKLTDTIKDKLVYAKDVREVLSWVETGNVDAGVVYETDAKISDKVEISCTAPEDSHKKVIYPVGVVKESKAADAAKAFVEYLFGDEAKTVFEKYGFSPVA
ncbi:molybdate ABC transporter substrate-binding protein [Marasmitruncus massiliensis]|uniref:molybdate ABC transporter substrate-binding protein n=1 Tax=Marasmitruncus massiliensis TaxID=1944642 RepID=UPI001FA8B9BC|nr:molybdate ABC transporter substrate-binding protein [Marasmitruncus massiliensis]